MTRRTWLLALLLGIPAGAQAQPDADTGASLLIFPRVVADADADTLLLLSNTGSDLAHMRCTYVDGVPYPLPNGGQTIRHIPFDVYVLARQTTQWIVGLGRQPDPTDVPCDRDNRDCLNAGFDPGSIPSLGASFQGELLCVATDPSGFPIPTNDMLGSATILPRQQDGQRERYAAIGLRGLDTNDMNDVLCVGGQPSAACPNGAEYAACPKEWIVHYAAEERAHPVRDEDHATTRLTFVPCSQDLKHVQNPRVTVQVQAINELEQTFGAGVTTNGWHDVSLEEISSVFRESILGSRRAKARLTAPSTGSGIAVVARGGFVSSAAPAPATLGSIHVHRIGERSAGDRIVLRDRQEQR